MSAHLTLVVNGRPVRVGPGDTPLEDAVSEGMISPVQGLHGSTVLGQAAGPATRRRTGDEAHSPRPVALAEKGHGAAIKPAEASRHPAAKRTGIVSELQRLCPGIVQAIVTLDKPLDHEPGHQVELTAGHHPPVTLTPTLRVDGSTELNEMVFHLACEAGVFVGSLADALQVGTPVTVKGPVGRGHYRRGGGRLVLVADEAGFAGIWAIARAARYIEPDREIHLFVGARDPLDLYMQDGLDWLRATGVARIVKVADRNRQRPPDVKPGPLTAHISMLRANDAVHVSGRPATVGAVEVLAAAVGARCYPIPLDPHA